jgi:integrase
MAAMVLLGLNCGFGNADCGRLPIKAIDFKGGWITFPRPKTGIERRCPLWPETIKMLKAVIEDRAAPKDPANGELLFVTKYGAPWHKETSDNPVSKEFSKVLKALKLERSGRNFYTLRHVFATVGGETKDAPAVSAIMGHDPGDMASVYRETISDERFRAVTDHVRAWLFPPKPRRKPKAKC